MRRLEDRVLPQDMDYLSIHGLRMEAGRSYRTSAPTTWARPSPGVRRVPGGRGRADDLFKAGRERAPGARGPQLMMKLTQVKGNTWVIEAMALIPFYKLDDRRVTCWTPACGRRGRPSSRPS